MGSSLQVEDGDIGVGGFWRVAIAVCAIAGLTGGCSTVPSSGPTSTEIVSTDPVNLDRYVVVDIDQRVANILAAQPRATLFGTFKDRRPRPDLRVGIGDGLTITVWEAAAGGLFSSAVADRASPGSRTATIPEQIVSSDGTIAVPYAGRVHVAGKRPAQIEQDIVEALKGKAVEPQAVVTLSHSVSNSVTVTGEVTNGARVPLSLAGDRILGVIASTGGIRAAANESFVRLTRDGHTASVAFNKIIADPRENIYARPGDVITVVREPQTFTAFGGTGKNASIPFESTGITLEEAVAKAGGLLDARADPSGVFLLRFEPASLVAKLSPADESRFTEPSIPVVYRLNLRDAGSYFLARTIPMQNRDILYVANAPLSEVSKVLAVIGQVASPVAAGAALYSVSR